MPIDSASYQQALAAGYTPQEIDAHLQGQQYEGALRLPAMAASEFLSGAETIPSLLARVGNSITQSTNPLDGPPAHPFPDVMTATNELGATNNMRLAPGYGAHPELERFLAAGVRGAGTVLPAVLGGPVAAAVGLGVGAGAGMAGEAAEQAFPNNPLIDVGVPLGLGLLGGGAADVALASRAIANAPTVAARLGGIVNDLKAGGQSVFNAGNAVQGELMTRNSSFLNAMGLDQLLKIKPHKVPDAVVQDPNLAQGLRQVAPQEMDQVAGAIINRNPQQWSKLQPEVKNALLPDQGMQDELEGALSQAKAGQSTVADQLTKQNSNWRYILGGSAGLLAHSIGLLPMPSYLDPMTASLASSFLGEAGGEILHRTVSNAAARMILGPILNPGAMGRQGAVLGGLGAVGGSNPGQVEPPMLAPQ